MGRPFFMIKFDNKFMDKRTVFLLLVLFGIIISALLSINKETSNYQVCFKNNCFEVKLADNIKKREQGLMFVRELGSGQGTLFVFEREEIYPFWMKNTIISLDIIWLDQERKIVFIKENAQPCVDDFCPNIVPDGAAKYVLEINNGQAKEFNLEIGDQADFYGNKN